jgi:predicted DNA-binding transcriptional regulator YafY
LWVARRLAPGLGDTVFGRGLGSLYGKLAAPGPQGELALGAETSFRARAAAAIDYGPHRITLDTIRDALETRHALHIRYRRADGDESTRVIEPGFLHFEPATEGVYVRAWCRLRGEARTFAVHRILSCERLVDTVTPRRELADDLSRAFRLWARPTAQRVVLRFAARVAQEVRERAWHASQRMANLPGGGVELELTIAAPEELERTVLGFAGDVTVVTPRSLAERVQQRHAEAAAGRRLPTLRARVKKVRREPGTHAARRGTRGATG